jgi:hypothetical protein
VIVQQVSYTLICGHVAQTRYNLKIKSNQ